jgi:hypothetical protein
VLYHTGARQSHPNVTCVYCRAKWVSASSADHGTSASGHLDEGYLNLAGVAGVSPVRDESTCEFLFHSTKLQFVAVTHGTFTQTIMVGGDSTATPTAIIK